MRIVELDGHGGPEVLQVGEAPVPSPGETEILVKIKATSVTAGDVALRRQTLGRFLLFWPVARLFFGIKNQRKKVLGHEFSGIVEARGAGVREFEVGDAVFGTTGFRGGAYAEYICVDQHDVVCSKPDNLSFEEAAVLPIGGQVALFFLEQAHIQPGDRVLIHGASGSIGTYAVQIAAHLGAHVTGVCSTPNLELVASLGAEQTIDYRKEEIDGSDTKYDIVFDTVGKLPRKTAKAMLAEGGRYLSTHSSPVKESVGLLSSVRDLASGGRIRPVIDKTVSLEEIPEAHRYVETGRKRGNVVVVVDR